MQLLLILLVLEALRASQQHCPGTGTGVGGWHGDLLNLET